MGTPVACELGGRVTSISWDGSELLSRRPPGTVGLYTMRMGNRDVLPEPRGDFADATLLVTWSSAQYRLNYSEDPQFSASSTRAVAARRPMRRWLARPIR